MKCFYITNDCIFQDNKLFIALLTNLSKIKSLFLFKIAMKGELNLGQNDIKEISEIMPNIIIKKRKKEYLIHWYNDN